MQSFEIIIGMDWLSYFHARVDCFSRQLSFTTPFGKIHVLRGEWGFMADRGISVKKLVGMLTAELTSLTLDASSVSASVEFPPVVRDSPDVFPEDFSGLPPVREVEFSIELVPGT